LYRGITEFKKGYELRTNLVKDQNGSWGEWLEGVEWIQLAQDRDQWQVLVNAVMKLRFWRSGDF
jgi:hypothetical protein